MYIIVVRAGKVGYYLAKELVEEGHEVLAIEKDAGKAERIAEELGDISLRGDGCEASTMEMAGFGRADMVIAVTGDDEDNLVTCQVAKAKFKVPRTIAPIGRLRGVHDGDGGLRPRGHGDRRDRRRRGQPRDLSGSEGQIQGAAHDSSDRTAARRPRWRWRASAARTW